MEKQNKMQYYHNNRCRKSREGLALIDLLKKLNVTAAELIRKSESVYKENIREKNLSNDQLIDWMIKEPKLIERPILVNNELAEIGRPKENFLKIIT